MGSQHLCEGSRMLSGGLARFHAVAGVGCSHDRVVTGGGFARVALGNPPMPGNPPKPDMA